MDGVTDASMRAFLTTRPGFSWCVSEFLRVNNEAPPAHVFFRHVPELRNGGCTASGVPVHVQLLGGDPVPLAKAAALAAQLGAPAVDLNFGCPAPTVNRHDGGATLLKFPDRIRGIVSAVRAAVPKEVPVSAKIRLGWDCDDAVFANAEAAAEGGASWLTIHGRTRDDGYKPPARWEPIGQVRERLRIPVIANGDLWTLDDVRRCYETTGCTHFMIGRGAMAEPELAGRALQWLQGRTPDPAPPATDGTLWLERFQRFSQGCDPDQLPRLLPRAKQWLQMARARTPIPWWDEAKRTTTFGDLEHFLRTRT